MRPRPPDPATGETLANVAEGDAEDIDRAARAAFDDGPWSRMTPSDRGRLIWRIGDLILEGAVPTAVPPLAHRAIASTSSRNANVATAVS